MHDEGKRLRIMRAEQEVAIARGIDPLQHAERGEHFLEQPPERNRAPIGLRQELMRRRETAQSRLKRGDEVPRLRPVLAAHADDAADHGQHVLHAMGELLVEQLSRLLLLPPRGDVEAKPGENERLAVVVALDDAGFEGEPADFAGLAPPQPELVAQLTPGVERRAYRLS